MIQFHYSYALEVGTYTPQDPRFIHADTPEEAAQIAKDLYEAKPFTLFPGAPPFKGVAILFTYRDNDQFCGATFDYNTLQRS